MVRCGRFEQPSLVVVVVVVVVAAAAAIDAAHGVLWQY